MVEIGNMSTPGLFVSCRCGGEMVAPLNDSDTLVILVYERFQ